MAGDTSSSTLAVPATSRATWTAGVVVSRPFSGQFIHTLRNLSPEEAVELARLKRWTGHIRYERSEAYGLTATVHIPHRAPAPIDEESVMLLQLINGLAKVHYKFDPQARRKKGFSTIAGAIENTGIDINKDTLRQWVTIACTPELQASLKEPICKVSKGILYKLILGMVVDCYDPKKKQKEERYANGKVPIEIHQDLGEPDVLTIRKILGKAQDKFGDLLWGRKSLVDSTVVPSAPKLRA